VTHTGAQSAARIRHGRVDASEFADGAAFLGHANRQVRAAA
jgi:hypothetical protein